MFREEFLNLVWQKGAIEAEELAKLLHTTTDVILTEAHISASQGWIRILDSLIVATPLTNQHHSA